MNEVPGPEGQAPAQTPKEQGSSPVTDSTLAGLDLSFPICKVGIYISSQLRGDYAHRMSDWVIVTTSSICALLTVYITLEDLYFIESSQP